MEFVWADEKKLPTFCTFQHNKHTYEKIVVLEKKLNFHSRKTWDIIVLKNSESKLHVSGSELTVRRKIVNIHLFVSLLLFLIQTYLFFILLSA